jgi:hypothetical protein
MPFSFQNGLEQIAMLVLLPVPHGHGAFRLYVWRVQHVAVPLKEPDICSGSRPEADSSPPTPESFPRTGERLVQSSTVQRIAVEPTQ